MDMIEEKIDLLFGYRAALDDEDKEVFDLLVYHAREFVRQHRLIENAQLHG